MTAYGMQLIVLTVGVCVGLYGLATMRRSSTLRSSFLFMVASVLCAISTGIGATS